LQRLAFHLRNSAVRTRRRAPAMALSRIPTISPIVCSGRASRDGTQLRPHHIGDIGGTGAAGGGHTGRSGMDACQDRAAERAKSHRTQPSARNPAPGDQPQLGFHRIARHRRAGRGFSSDLALPGEILRTKAHTAGRGLKKGWHPLMVFCRNTELVWDNWSDKSNQFHS
jgi:hypothetical protein